jgi:hypothetical protein
MLEILKTLAFHFMLLADCCLAPRLSLAALDLQQQ